MKRLILLRHAKAVPAGTGPDHERDLDARGLRDAAWAGTAIAAGGWTPTAALVSDARRTRRTFEQALPALDPPPALLVEPRLYDAAMADIMDCIGGASATAHSLLVIGHNPGLAETAVHLARGAEAKLRARLARDFPTGALAVFTLDTPSWTRLRTAAATLDAVLTPPP